MAPILNSWMVQIIRKWARWDLYQTTKYKVETPEVVVVDSRSYSQSRRPPVFPARLPCRSFCRTAGKAAQTEMHQCELSMTLEIDTLCCLVQGALSWMGWLPQDKCQCVEGKGCCVPWDFSFSNPNMHPVYKGIQVFLEHLPYCSARAQHDGIPALCTSWHCKSYK